MTLRRSGADTIGLFDTADTCWMGDETGPLTYDDPALARLAAEVLSVRLGWSRARICPMPYNGDANHRKDEIATTMTVERALLKLESEAP